MDRPPSPGPAAPPADSSGELVDVIGPDGAVVEVVTRARMRAERLRHRCTFVVVRDPAGRVLVHRRSPHKDLWPSHWDLAAGGVVGSGEDWDDAARRELAEEVGISGVPLVPLGEGAYADAHVDELARLWTVTWDGPVTFDDGEVVEAHWVEPDELRLRLERDPFVPDSVALLGPLLLGSHRPGPHRHGG